MPTCVRAKNVRQDALVVKSHLDLNRRECLCHRHSKCTVWIPPEYGYMRTTAKTLINQFGVFINSIQCVYAEVYVSIARISQKQHVSNAQCVRIILVKPDSS
jgi:hypothetical protein